MTLESVGLDLTWNSVREFHEMFEHPSAASPTLLPKERVLKRSSWMRDEIDEFIAAESLVDQADAMVDLLYFAIGSLVEMGVPPQRLFEIVHNANMSKAAPDGSVRYGDDGKVLKPTDWKPPEPEMRAYIESLMVSRAAAE